MAQKPLFTSPLLFGGYGTRDEQTKAATETAPTQGANAPSLRDQQRQMMAEQQAAEARKKVEMRRQAEEEARKKAARAGKACPSYMTAAQCAAGGYGAKNKTEVQYLMDKGKVVPDPDYDPNTPNQ